MALRIVGVCAEGFGRTSRGHSSVSGATHLLPPLGRSRIELAIGEHHGALLGLPAVASKMW